MCVNRTNVNVTAHLIFSDIQLLLLQAQLWIATLTWLLSKIQLYVLQAQLWIPQHSLFHAPAQFVCGTNRDVLFTTVLVKATTGLIIFRSPVVTFTCTVVNSTARFVLHKNCACKYDNWPEIFLKHSCYFYKHSGE